MECATEAAEAAEARIVPLGHSVWLLPEQGCPCCRVGGNPCHCWSSGAESELRCRTPSQPPSSAFGGGPRIVGLPCDLAGPWPLGPTLDLGDHASGDQPLALGAAAVPGRCTTDSRCMPESRSPGRCMTEFRCITGSRSCVTP
ncbi:hypothetical protein Vafri_17278 [Volvox africanus]|uniref:Uncharacterized protein n=1 Tax=Volvox africanus TaxID=51714 RepID=A0A8J4BKR0_9CHLO|nr:hypothetical protein Vafri_17278 [Volvox africanus]